MSISLFYKSCSKDFDWLKYSRDSVRKFCSGYSEIVLCLPEGETFDWPEARILNIRETFTPYLFQQSVKLFADTWCKGEFVTFQDSDTIFNRPVNFSEFFRDGKPIWITRPYDSARSDQQIWRLPTEKFLGGPVNEEGMYRHPFTVPRDVLQRIRGFCQFRHGVSLDEYIKSQAVPDNPLALVFSEWNAVSAFAKSHCPEKFHWIDASKEEPPPACVLQGHTWSGDGRKKEDLAKFREILNGSTPLVGQPEGASLAPPALNEDEAIKFLASVVRDNFHKARIIKKLKREWEGKGEAHRKRTTAISAAA